MPERLRHAILGVGGVGGLIGASLAHSGACVTLIVRPDVLAAYPTRLHVESPFGKFEVEIAKQSDVPPCDVLWLTVKATQLEAALKAIKSPDVVRAILPLQNGVDHLTLLRSRYGSQKVIPATVAVESERIAPGHIIHRSPFARLSALSSGKPLLEGTLEHLQRIGFECRFVDDEPTLMWGKLVFLAPFALLTTAGDITTSEILSDPEWRQLGLSCIREACAVALAEGAKLDADTVIAGVMKMPGNMRSSMQKDVEQGKAPELDAIAGPILRGARRHGIEVPVTHRLVEMVQSKTGATVLA